ncbi:MAG: hypothetical protein M1438_11970 [Deltaproteobacteria bacterium]|nr:hypothetical protein [Deltaproteobacteria bacterium]
MDSPYCSRQAPEPVNLEIFCAIILKNREVIKEIFLAFTLSEKFKNAIAAAEQRIIPLVTTARLGAIAKPSFSVTLSEAKDLGN